MDIGTSSKKAIISPANQGIAALAPYQPGKPVSELKRELGLTHVVKLASNENPLGCSPNALAAMQSAVSDIGRYPDGNGFVLKQAISNYFGVAIASITLGNGSNDILELVARTFLSEHDSAVYSQHAFAVYSLAVQAVGAECIEVPAKQFAHDLPAMAAAIKPNTKVIFIANPNNPTGTWFDLADFEVFIVAVPPQVLVVLDEAYVEYFPDTHNRVAMLAKYPNLLISRTFSKAYGLAALRVGFALASEHLTNLLNRVRQPFNVNALALEAAAAALADTLFTDKTRATNNSGMAQLVDGIQRLGLDFIPSKANFLCINVAHKGLTGMQVFQELLKLGVIIRPVDNYGMPDYIRVTIGLAAENQFFLDSLARVLDASHV